MANKKQLRSFTPRERNRVQKEFKKPSRTKQADRQTSDINYIMKRYGGISNIPAGSVPLNYYDTVGAPTYEEALMIVSRGKDAFNSLTAVQRAHFDNDPVKFLQLMDDPSRKEEAISLGILKAPAGSKEPAAKEPPATPPADPKPE